MLRSSLLLIMVALATTHANAEIITLRSTGNYFRTQDLVGLSLVADPGGLTPFASPYTATVDIDLSAVDTDPNPNIGRYSITSTFSLVVDGLEFLGTTNGVIRIDNDIPFPSGSSSSVLDSFFIDFNGIELPVGWSTVAASSAFNSRRIDFTGNSFQSDSLSEIVTAVSSNFTGGTLPHFDFVGFPLDNVLLFPGGSLDVRSFRISFFESQFEIIPEPSSFVLMLSAAGGLLLFSLRSKRSPSGGPRLFRSASR